MLLFTRRPTGKQQMLPQVTHFKVRRDWQSHTPCSQAPSSRLERPSLAGPGDRAPEAQGTGRASWPRGSYSPPITVSTARFTPEPLAVPSPPPKASGDPTAAGCLQTRLPDPVLHPQIDTKPWNRNVFPPIEVSACAETRTVRWHGVIQPRQSSH